MSQTITFFYYSPGEMEPTIMSGKITVYKSFSDLMTSLAIIVDKTKPKRIFELEYDAPNNFAARKKINNVNEWKEWILNHREQYSLHVVPVRMGCWNNLTLIYQKCMSIAKEMNRNEIEIVFECCNPKNPKNYIDFRYVDEKHKQYKLIRQRFSKKLHSHHNHVDKLSQDDKLFLDKYGIVAFLNPKNNSTQIGTTLSLSTTTIGQVSNNQVEKHDPIMNQNQQLSSMENNSNQIDTTLSASTMIDQQEEKSTQKLDDDHPLKPYLKQYIDEHFNRISITSWIFKSGITQKQLNQGFYQWILSKHMELVKNLDFQPMLFDKLMFLLGYAKWSSQGTNYYPLCLKTPIVNIPISPPITIIPPITQIPMKHRQNPTALVDVYSVAPYLKQYIEDHFECLQTNSFPKPRGISTKYLNQGFSQWILLNQPHFTKDLLTQNGVFTHHFFKRMMVHLGFEKIQTSGIMSYPFQIKVQRQGSIINNYKKRQLEHDDLEDSYGAINSATLSKSSNSSQEFILIQDGDEKATTNTKSSSNSSSCKDDDDIVNLLLGEIQCLNKKISDFISQRNKKQRTA